MIENGDAGSALKTIMFASTRMSIIFYQSSYIFSLLTSSRVNPGVFGP
jgi:hypothetical protein